MNILIITQKVSKNDPVLGFFHRWIEELAKHYDLVSVICLEKGDYSLPKNVQVFSLGKENGPSVLKYVWNFYKYIFINRRNYDAVFVHMNQEYVLLGSAWWFFMGKPVYFWRNHAKGNWLTDIAVLISKKVFCTSTHSYTAKFNKTIIMPVGIDTNFFSCSKDAERRSKSILFLGRISPVKRVELFVDLLSWLHNVGIEFSATLAGAVLTEDVAYSEKIFAMIKDRKIEKRVAVIGAVNQDEALNLYRKHEFYINLTPSGSMDKTIFEAAACGAVVLASNKALKSQIPDELVLPEEDGEPLKKAVMRVIDSDVDKVKSWSLQMTEFVSKNHSLTALVSSLEREISK